MADVAFGGPVILDNSAWARLLGGSVAEAPRQQWLRALERDVLAGHTDLSFDSHWLARRGTLDQR